MEALLTSVVDLNTTRPVDLRASFRLLSASFSRHLREAEVSPVRIHLLEMRNEVERRSESEVRDSCRNALDKCVTLIKRRGRRKEPARVLRFIDHCSARERGFAATAMERVLRGVERRGERRAFRARVLAGEFLPKLTAIDVAGPVAEHLTYMTCWLEKDVACRSSLSLAVADRAAALREFPKTFERERAGEERRRREEEEGRGREEEREASKKVEEGRRGELEREKVRPVGRGSCWSVRVFLVVGV